MDFLSSLMGGGGDPATQVGEEEQRLQMEMEEQSLFNRGRRES